MWERGCRKKKEGVSSIYLNPASIIGIEYEEVIFVHNEWIDDISYDVVGYGKKKGNRTFALMGLWLHMPKIEGRKPNREVLDYEAYDFSLVFTYAKKVSYGILGGSIKSILSRIEEQNAKGYAVDIGWLFEKENFNMGASISNLGPKLQFKNESSSLPLIFRIGISFEDKRGRDLFNVVKETGEPFSLHLGGEFPLKRYPIFLRIGGYTDLKENNRIGGGFGIEYKNTFFDYAYLPFEDVLGNIHSVSFKLRF